MPSSVEPIRSDTDHAAAMAEIEQLWGQSSVLQTVIASTFSSMLVVAYEAKHHPIDPRDRIEAIKEA